MHEGVSAINRVNDPASFGRAGTLTLFFAKHGVVRKVFFERPTQIGFGLAVGHGHEGAVGLAVGRDAPAEVMERDLARAPREINREVEQ